MDTDSLFQLPDCVRQDVAGYGAEVERHLRGETNPVAFRAYRVPMGVYEHRENDHFMTRVRLGAGLVLPHQLQRIAELSRKHGNGVLHATTRQDLQIHDVSIEATVHVQAGLAAIGLSARGGGGNTVRNVTACPRASVCPHARFDVAPHAIALAEYLLAHPKSFTLPRKYKIAFSGCAED
ncbi:MAG TPA: sulfite reductase, beta subunit (hemoprotein), partial [Polyangia bacterium]